jgi:phosphoenolpyruvate synthase/pyruvate phosphate dikinase
LYYSLSKKANKGAWRAFGNKRSTDPGWTPIFGLLGADHGEWGQLSNGAVVVREYGLRAVAGIAWATQLLYDGQVVLLDGLSGTVTVIISGS